MEGDSTPDARTSPTLRLQTTVADFPAPSLSPTFKLDEGYSDETRSQAEKDPGSDNVMMLPNWVLAQSEAGRAGENFLMFTFLSPYCRSGKARISSLSPLPSWSLCSSC